MITAMPRIAIAVRDMDRAITTFRDQLGMPVYEFDWVRTALGIRMSLCVPAGGSHIELMAPEDPARAHSKSLIRFLDRRGEGLFALMLYAPNPNAEAEVLATRGLEVMPLMQDAGGRDIHPKRTHGVLIRIYPSAMAADLERELEQGLGPISVRESRAHLSGISRVILAVRDLDDAVAVYRDRLGIRTRLQGDDAARGVRVAVCTPSSGGTVELRSSLGDRGGLGRELAAFLREHGEGMYALVLESANLDATASALRARGIDLQRSATDPAQWEIDAAVVHGARIRIEPRSAAG
ncbi:MAG TPA: VOC family protein [Candidatus Binatia bacterium]|nr:VOC family protein [Candidatus Binatia bacterium]